MYVSVFFFSRYKDDLTSSNKTANRDSIRSNVFEGKGEGLRGGETVCRKFPLPLPNASLPPMFTPPSQWAATRALEGLAEPGGVVALGVEGCLAKPAIRGRESNRKKSAGAPGSKLLTGSLKTRPGSVAQETDEVGFRQHAFAHETVGDGQGEVHAREAVGRLVEGRFFSWAACGAWWAWPACQSRRT